MLDPSEFAQDAPCGVPVSWQIERLALELEGAWAGEIRIVATDLYGLDDVERSAAVDAVVAGDVSPYVILDGTIVSRGTIDPAAVLAALRLRDSRA